MSWTQKLLWLSGLSLALFAFGAQAQDEPTMVILPDPAADRADAVTQAIGMPDEAADGLATAQENSAQAQGNAPEGAEAAADGLAEAQANAAEAAEQGLQTAIDAVEGARGDLGRSNMPENLPEQVPADLPAVPENTVPEGTDLPNPPAPPVPPAPPIGG